VSSPARPRTVRDPLWHNVPLDADAASVVDTPEFQRLRRVKQLGFAHLVYPGAVHTRFLHALGVYHLCRRAMERLEERGLFDELDADDRDVLPLVPLAALLRRSSPTRSRGTTRSWPTGSCAPTRSGAPSKPSTPRRRSTSAP